MGRFSKKSLAFRNPSCITNTEQPEDAKKLHRALSMAPREENAEENSQRAKHLNDV